jgi:DivIVA domain-containing protein
VALERQSIEKKDFPIGRRGYDTDAVDAHLKSLADEIEEFRHATRRRAETLASTASDRVRAIVEAAEYSAAEIHRHAEDEAREIRAEAGTEAQTTRERASSQAREYLGKVSESTTVLLQRLEAMEGELGALIESLRTGSNRLGADLQLLEANLSEVNQAVTQSRFGPEHGAYVAPVADDDVPLGALEVPAAQEVAAIEEVAVLEQQPIAEAEPAADASQPPAAAGDGAEDAEGARLIALNMALNGTPREETDRYLAENFELSDRATLLDEVYASVGG